METESVQNHPWAGSVFSMRPNYREAPFRVLGQLSLTCVSNKFPEPMLLVGSGDHTLRTTRWKGWLEGQECPQSDPPRPPRSTFQVGHVSLAAGDISMLRGNAQASAGHTDLEEVLTPPLTCWVLLGGSLGHSEPQFPHTLVGRRTSLSTDK